MDSIPTTVRKIREISDRWENESRPPSEPECKWMMAQLWSMTAAEPKLDKSLIKKIDEMHQYLLRLIDQQQRAINEQERLTHSIAKQKTRILEVLPYGAVAIRGYVLINNGASFDSVKRFDGDLPTEEARE